MSETRFPDIEIYLRDATTDGIMDWLRQEFPRVQLRVRAQNKQTLRLELASDTGMIPVALFTDAVPGYTVAWFDSPATPWDTDLECARAAAAHLGCEVRCSTGGWDADDAELWWCVRAEQVEQVTWR